MSDHAQPTPVPGVRIVDGNALAGILSDVFLGDATLLELCCGECGAVGVLGGAVVEDDGVAAIVRCRSCTHTLLTVLRRGTGVRLSLAAVRRIDVPGAG